MLTLAVNVKQPILTLAVNVHQPILTLAIHVPAECVYNIPERVYDLSE
jgi:hypothetical protein